jgi:trehalose/maltose hydrolase-like predicted phosphorylase
MNDLWTLTETTFDPKSLHHKETIYTIGNGYLYMLFHQPYRNGC